MIGSVQFVVAAGENGSRLDAVVRARFPSSTAALVRRAIEAEEIRLGDRLVLKGAKVCAGDIVRIERLLESSDLRVTANPNLPIEILFAGDDLVAVNKPAGMAVHPLRPEETDTLANGLVARFPEIAELGDQPLLAGVAHRIDTDTSGVVLACRTVAAWNSVRAQFAAQRVRKTYLALVAGRVDAPGELTHDLAHQPSFRGRMVDARTLRDPDRPMHAVTAYRPLRPVGAWTLLEVTIHTGVTHQIRCQLALAGHPLVGDTLYGGPALPGFPRQFLHASAVVLEHPRTGAPLRIEAPLTEDLRAFLEPWEGTQ
jgi:23S rRNA pseudouridine1911/1915/1917 synthase